MKNLQEFVPMVSYELHVTYFYLHDLSSCIVPNNRSHDIDSNDIKIYISPFSPFSTFLGLFRPFSTSVAAFFDLLLPLFCSKAAPKKGQCWKLEAVSTQPSKAKKQNFCRLTYSYFGQLDSFFAETDRLDKKQRETFLAEINGFGFWQID